MTCRQGGSQKACFSWLGWTMMKDSSCALQDHVILFQSTDTLNKKRKRTGGPHQHHPQAPITPFTQRPLKALYALILVFVLMWTRSLYSNSLHSLTRNSLRIRLPEALESIQCYLQWVVDSETGKYGGRVIHEFMVVHATRDIVLHSVDLDTSVLNPTLSCSEVPDLIPIHPLPTSVYAQAIQFQLDSQLQIHQQCNLTLYFTSTLQDKYSWGFFRQSYTNNSTGQVDILAATHFEPTGARSAFPCFDEPAMKAVFHVSIVTSSDYHVVSNTPSQSRLSIDPLNGIVSKVFSRTTPDLILHHFQPTPKMSSYLVAAAISKLDKLVNTTRHVQVSVYSQPGHQSQIELALHVASYCVSFYEDYFGIKYPLSKLDLVPVPFFSGEAMENWQVLIIQ